MNKWLVIAVVAVVAVGIFIWISSRGEPSLVPARTKMLPRNVTIPAGNNTNSTIPPLNNTNSTNIPPLNNTNSTGTNSSNSSV